MTTHALYKSQPLQCWGQAKELRLNHFKAIATARQQGKLLVSGGAETPTSLLAGLGDAVFWAGEPYGATVATDADFSRECAEASEAQGFARDLCSYMRNYWGSMFLNRYFFGGPFPHPDFCIQLHFCDSHAKWYQVVAEHYGIPYFSLDYPLLGPEEKKPARVEYLASQMADAIDWMEKTTGRKYDDEKFIQAVRNECRASSLWAEIMTLNKNIPAPLDQKSIFSLYIIAVMMRDLATTVSFYETLRDEVKYRVAHQIAALATERCRLLDDSPPPWHFLQIYRYLEQYGAVVVASFYSLLLGGSMAEQPDGTWGPPKTPEERADGSALKTREDAVRALALWYIERPIFQCFFLPQWKTQVHLRLVREWKGNGMLLHLNRGCEGLTLGTTENRLALLQAGIPVMAYEGNMADRREFDEAQTLDRVDSFMESLGLRKLET